MSADDKEQLLGLQDVSSGEVSRVAVVSDDNDEADSKDRTKRVLVAVGVIVAGNVFLIACALLFALTKLASDRASTAAEVEKDAKMHFVEDGTTAILVNPPNAGLQLPATSDEQFEL